MGSLCYELGGFMMPFVATAGAAALAMLVLLATAGDGWGRPRGGDTTATMDCSEEGGAVYESRNQQKTNRKARSKERTLPRIA